MQVLRIVEGKDDALDIGSSPRLTRRRAVAVIKDELDGGLLAAVDTQCGIGGGVGIRDPVRCSHRTCGDRERSCADQPFRYVPLHQRPPPRLALPNECCRKSRHYGQKSCPNSITIDDLY